VRRGRLISAERDGYFVAFSSHVSTQQGPDRLAFADHQGTIERVTNLCLRWKTQTVKDRGRKILRLNPTARRKTTLCVGGTIQ
ncbi:MAG: hypothetical protein QGG09_16885, partial [Pirellulaceae bacterium]|nr:hypothetical protein [Pirellulaceae bacterium]